MRSSVVCDNDDLLRFAKLYFEQRFFLTRSLLDSLWWLAITRRPYVFCTRCKGSEMIDYNGSEKNDDLVLEGSYAKCGHQVVRVVETSEAKPPNN